MLAQYAERLAAIETLAPLGFHHRDDFAKDWRLKEGIAPRAIGQIGAGWVTPP